MIIVIITIIIIIIIIIIMIVIYRNLVIMAGVFSGNLRCLCLLLSYFAVNERRLSSPKRSEVRVVMGEVYMHRSQQPSHRANQREYKRIFSGTSRSLIDVILLDSFLRGCKYYTLKI